MSYRGRWAPKSLRSLRSLSYQHLPPPVLALRQRVRALLVLLSLRGMALELLCELFEKDITSQSSPHPLYPSSEPCGWIVPLGTKCKATLLLLPSCGAGRSSKQGRRNTRSKATFHTLPMERNCIREEKNGENAPAEMRRGKVRERERERERE